MDFETRSEFAKVYKALRCKANCNSIYGIIEVTKSEFLALSNSNNLKYPAIYKITDVEGFSELFITTTSANTFSLDCNGLLIVPNYAVSGSNLGQLNANDIQTVNDGEKVIWADHYWINNSGSPVIPTISSLVELDVPMELIEKSVNDYDEIIVDVTITDVLDVASIFNPTNIVTYTYLTNASNDLYKYLAVNNSGLYNLSISTIANHYGQISNTNNISLDLSITNNSGGYSSIIIEGSNNEVTSNNIDGLGNCTSVRLVNSCRFNNNTATGANYNIAHFTGLHLNDNSEIVDNQIVGNGAIWDIIGGEECKVNGNILNSGVTVDESSTAVIQDIDQMYQDEVNENELTGLGARMSMIHQFGTSKVNGNQLTGEYTHISRIRQCNGELLNCVLATNGKHISDLELRNATIQNATDLTIKFIEVSNLSIDLTGFTQDIISETIQAGKGWFTITHDFDAAPLTSGSSVYYNLIPIGARLTNCTIIPDSLSGGADATLRIGLEGDDVSYGLVATVLASITNTMVNTISNVATANRSLQLTAGVNNITGGTVTVKVEFVI